MTSTLRRPGPLVARPLRTLTVDPLRHPRGQHHISAASGLVCAHGRAYVIADDEHHLAVFRDAAGPGELHRVFPGDLPHPKKARKKLKPDLETLFLLPALRASAHTALVALGSGSRANRDTGCVVPLDSAGEPSPRVQRFDLAPVYGPLRERLGEINIEGAMVIGEEWVLLHRGVAGSGGSASLHYRLRDLHGLIAGRAGSLPPCAVRRHALGSLDGVELGFTDGAALPDGGWVFCAVAENTEDSYADGACHGSMVGVVDASGQVVARHRLAVPAKVEGIAVQAQGSGLSLCMVTDADDPAQGSQMLLARL